MKKNNNFLKNKSKYDLLIEKINEKTSVDKLKERLADYLRKISGQKLVEFVANATKQSYAQVLKGAMSNVADIGKKGTSSFFKYIKDKAEDIAKKTKDTIDDMARTDDEKKKHRDEENQRQDDASKKEKDELKVKELDLDPHTTTFDCMFDHGDAAKLQDILKKIEEEKKKSLKLAEDIAKQLPERLEKAGCPDISKDVLDKYGLAIAGLIAKGYKKDKLRKAIDDMQNNTKANNEKPEEQVDESMLLNENALIAGINFALSLVGGGLGNIIQHDDGFERIIIGDNGTDVDGFFSTKSQFSMDGVAGKATTKLVGKSLWLLIALQTAKMIIRHRKELGDTISNFANKIKKRQNIIATMNFMFDDTKYSVRYNIKDFKWILVDTDNPKEKTDKVLLKSALESELGKKFRSYCSKIWDPIYKPDDGAEKSMFEIILNNNDDLNLGLKIPKELLQIGNDYTRIQKTCISDNYNI